MSAYRHELKMLIEDGAAELLARRLPLILRRDRHAGESGRYMVRSLYFDDAELDFYADKLAGIDRRAKYRLRCYNLDDSFIVFEKKEKHGDLCLKSSVRVSAATAEAMLEANLASLPRGVPLIDEFAALTRAAALRPVVLVDYERAAFTYPLSNTRVTLDLDVRTSVASGFELFGDLRSSIPAMEPGEQILEVKFDDFLPSVVSAALDDVPAQRMAISKYCKCLALLV